MTDAAGSGAPEPDAASLAVAHAKALVADAVAALREAKPAQETLAELCPSVVCSGSRVPRA